MSRKARKVILWSSPLVSLLLLGLLGKLKLDSVHREAGLLANNGQAATKLLAEYAAGIAARDVDRIAENFAPEALGESRIFGEVKELPALARDGVRVYAWDAADAGGAAHEQLSKLLATVRTFELAKFKLRLVEQIPSPDEAIVRSVMWLRGRDVEDREFESFATYRIRIQRREQSWKILGQQLLHGQTVTGEAIGFRNELSAVQIDFSSQFNPDWWTPEWDPKRYEMIKYGVAGVSTADVDGDGWYDLFFADGVASRLYLSNGIGTAGTVTFRDATTAAGLPADLAAAAVATFADFDNDGDQDLFIGRTTRENLLYRNDGAGAGTAVNFTDVSAGAGLTGELVITAAATDYDNDGLIDLYLGRFLDPRVSSPQTVFYSRTAPPNTLLRNLGDLRFADVTEEAGVGDVGMTLGSAWGDYNGDGYEDLYLANDYGRNVLYRNNGVDAAGKVTFTDVAQETGTLDFGYGMSATFGDVDNDGDLDLYTANLHSGQRWYGQATTIDQYVVNSLQSGTFFKDVPVYLDIYRLFDRRFSYYGEQVIKGNTLMINQGDERFTEVPEEAGTGPFGWYWGSTMLDYDNDGWQDIYATNGWISAPDTADL